LTKNLVTIKFLYHADAYKHEKNKSQLLFQILDGRISIPKGTIYYDMIAVQSGSFDSGNGLMSQQQDFEGFFCIHMQGTLG